MPRSRKYVRDPRTNLQVDGLSLHKPTRQCYSLDKRGQRIYWGNDLIRAIDDYRSSLHLGPLRSMTDDEALMRLSWDSADGIDEDEVSPEQIRRAKQNRFVVNNDWLASNRDHPLAVFVQTGKMPKRKQEPTPKVNPEGDLPPQQSAWMICGLGTAGPGFLAIGASVLFPYHTMRHPHS